MYDRLIGNVCYHKFYMIVECVIEHISGKYYNVWFIWKGKKQNGLFAFLFIELNICRIKPAYRS